MTTRTIPHRRNCGIIVGACTGCGSGSLQVTENRGPMGRIDRESACLSCGRIVFETTQPQK